MSSLRKRSASNSTESSKIVNTRSRTRSRRNSGRSSSHYTRRRSSSHYTRRRSSHYIPKKTSEELYLNSLQSCMNETTILCRYFSESYDEARAKFIHSCKDCNLEQVSLKIHCDYDNDLTINIGVLKGNRKNVLLHISGTHGVEAYAGSAIQNYIISRIAMQNKFGSAYNGPTIIFVHCLNPYGMKYGRRFNEKNIDLNRNYCSKELFQQLVTGQPSELYSEMNSWLNPINYREDCEMSFIEKLQAFFYTLRFGTNGVKQAVVGGQYHFPKGIFYGGKSLSQSHRILSNYVKTKLSDDIKRFAILDVHTGLGPKCIDTLLCNSKEEFSQLNNVTNHYENIQVRDPDKSITYRIHGNVIRGYSTLVPNHVKRLIAVQEFGTYKQTNVVMRVRSENSVYHYLKSRTNVSSLQKKLLNRPCQLRDVFCIDEREWRDRVISRGVTLFNQFNHWCGGTFIL